MRKSSINIQPMKADSWEHNNRIYTPKYAFKTNEVNEVINLVDKEYMHSVNTRFGTYEKINYKKIEEELKEKYQKSTGQKPQSKQIFIKEAVFNTNKNTTKEQLLKVAEMLEKSFNIVTLHIAHHKDEGKDPQNPNYHCHITFINVDIETGKSLLLDKTKLRTMQTKIAQILEMERGQDKRISKVQRVEHKEYKKAQAKIDKSVNFNKRLTEVAHKKLSEVNQKNRELTTRIEELEKSTFNVEEFENVKKDNQFLTDKLESLQELFNALGLDNINVYDNNDNKDLEKKIRERIEEDYKNQREQLKSSGIAKQQDYSNLKNIKDKVIDNLNNIFNDKKQLTKNVDNKNINNKNNKSIDIDI